MEPVAKLPYIKIIRKVEWEQQKITEERRVLTLYPDKITSKHREFPLKDVYEMTYRPMNESITILYLHTNKGVYTYPVTESPLEFIETYRNLRLN